MKLIFEASGPFKVCLYKGKNGRILRSAEANEFFKKHQAIGKKRGCYIHAIRSGGGIKPVYVGKATKKFSQECFATHKIGKCNEALVDYEKGSLVVLFLEAPTGKGRPNAKQIGFLEKFLIQAAIGVNADLLNVKGTKQAEWSIKGVIRSKKGKPSSSAAALKRVLAV